MTEDIGMINWVATPTPTKTSNDRGDDDYDTFDSGDRFDLDLGTDDFGF